jgi:RNA polymerase sigma-70 factor (ECF subfamily)
MVVPSPREQHFDRLAREHKDAVYRTMLRVCGNQEDAEDVLVDALLAAYRALDQLRDDLAFRSWLAQIGKRLCGRVRRKESVLPVMRFSEMELNPEGTEADPAQDVDEEVEKRELHACVERTILQIPKLYREVYLLREVEGLTAEETSAKLGLTIANVKTRLHRARAMVRDALDHSLCGGNVV